MKVETEIPIQASPEKIWGILTDFAAFPEWNPFIKAVRGMAVPAPSALPNGTSLEMDLADSRGCKTEAVVVSGFAAPKYFSWTHNAGSWWLAAEHVLRIKQREDGKVLFFNEAYYTGLSITKVLGFLDFRRDALTSKLKPSMLKMNEALKEKAEAP